MVLVLKSRNKKTLELAIYEYLIRGYSIKNKIKKTFWGYKVKLEKNDS